MVAVAGEMVAAALQQAVQGAAGMAAAGGRPQAGGGLAGGGGQLDAGGGIPLQHCGEHAGHRARLAGAGPALEQYQPMGLHRLDGLVLASIEGCGGRWANGAARDWGGGVSGMPRWSKRRWGGVCGVQGSHPLQQG